MTTGLFTSLPGLAVQPAKTDPNPLVIYHGKCPDGFGAALAAWLYFEGQGEYLGVSHGKVTTLDDLPPLSRGRTIESDLEAAFAFHRGETTQTLFD
mgnify:CR=1 FL=1